SPPSQRDARARTAHDAQVDETPTAILAVAAANLNRGMIQKKAVSGAKADPPPKPKLICETIIAIQLISAATNTSTPQMTNAGLPAFPAAGGIQRSIATNATGKNTLSSEAMVAIASSNALEVCKSDQSPIPSEKISNSVNAPMESGSR